jgi:hypothetical protein
MPWSRNGEFVGREETLNDIILALKPPAGDEADNRRGSRSRLRTFAICGPGGIGKSQLAAEFVHRARSQKLFDAIFWVRANDRGTLVDDLHRIAVRLGHPDEHGDARSQKKVLEHVNTWLRRPQKQSHDGQTQTASWLIVFDDVHNADYLKRMIDSQLTGAILVTTRDPSVQQDVLPSETHWNVLDPFDEKEATSFLMKETRRETKIADRNSAVEVAKLLGGYPLAIHQMATVIVDRDYTFSRFREHYDQAMLRNNLFSSRVGQSAGPPYHHTLATVWRLDDLRQSVCLLEVVSLLDAEEIPEIILQENRACKDWDAYPQTRDMFEDARYELLKASLITRDRDTEVMKTHSIIQDAVRSNMDQAHFDVLYRRVLCMLSAVWPYEDRFGFGDDNTRWTRPNNNGCDELFRHVVRLRTHFSRFKPATTLSKQSLEPYKLTLDAAWFSIMRSRFTETTPLLDMAESIQKCIHVPADPDPKVKLDFERLQRIYEHHRGTFALHTNDPKKSLAHLEKFTSMTSKLLGDCPSGTDQSMGVGWNELGNAYLQNDNVDKAAEYFLKSIKALEALDGAREISISMPLINLGFAQWLKGSLEEAEATFMKAYEVRKREYGIEDKTSFA